MGRVISKPKNPSPNQKSVIKVKKTDSPLPKSKLLDVKPSVLKNFDFDIFIIGGGSGGLACAQEAANFGVKVGLADFVKPSPVGSKWGLGGTCVNVGCIPKKLMHYTALLGEGLKDAKEGGWGFKENAEHKWETLVEKVQNHIQSLNYGYRKAINSASVTYYNKLASLISSNSILLTRPGEPPETITSKHVLIAVGGRPHFQSPLDLYKELVITSDDLFSLPKRPGKTLIIGASYIALECAGILTSLGNDTTVMVRSIPLRGFDLQMALKITEYMSNHGTKFLDECVPIKIEQVEQGKKRVFYQNKNKNSFSDDFDTVMLAIGRKPDVKNLGLEKLGVIIDQQTGKISVDCFEKTNISNIFAVGDCAHGRPELTPSAILAGKLLARRLFACGSTVMDYINIATTVFTPLEYSCIGFSEEDAIKKYGEKEIDVFHTYFKPLEWNLLDGRETNACYMKLISLKENKKVVGIHYLGPNAGEVIQGYSVAFKMGATKDIFERTVGIHPTCAEEFIYLDETKESNPNAAKTGC